MKHIASALRLLLAGAMVAASADGLAQSSAKEIFIPEELQDMNLNDTASTWCWERSMQTPNAIIFWEKGFGPSLDNPPSLEGKPMKVDLPNLAEKVERFYAFFRDSLRFTRHPGGKASIADRYKMMVMVKYSLEGTAYGGSYDGQIGALWLAPNRLQDKRLNCIAHELGHSFQFQIQADGFGDGWGGTGFFEMTSQWMLWQVNPDWVNDERFHWEAFARQTSKPFLALENIYHSPYILEYWSEKRGLSVIADLYRNSSSEADPAMTYMQLFSLTQQQFCDEMFQASCQTSALDFRHARPETRRCIQESPVPAASLSAPDADGWRAIDAEQAPGDYGFNVISLPIGGKARALQFQSLSTDPQAGFRFGLVYTDGQGRTHYGKPHAGLRGSIGKGEVKRLLRQGATKGSATSGTLSLVVMAAPLSYVKYNQATYSYKIK